MWMQRLHGDGLGCGHQSCREATCAAATRMRVLPIDQQNLPTARGTELPALASSAPRSRWRARMRA